MRLWESWGNMEIPQSYEGREHSLIKHELLKGYLEKLLLIKGMTGTRDITYVDCFAGPYGDETPDIKATSISISLDILNKVREILVSQGKDISLRAIYVEKKRSSYDRLKVYLDSNCPENIQAFPIYGEYAEKADEILQLCGDRNFTFFLLIRWAGLT